MGVLRIYILRLLFYKRGEIVIEAVLKPYIEKEAKKHIEKYQKYHNRLQIDWENKNKVLTHVKEKTVYTPDYWEVDKKFNPFYVLKNIDAITKSVSRKIISNTYKPYSPYKREIDKKGAGKREISIYMIPDAAVSNYLYNSLMYKNKHRFSSLAYAYRNDKNVHYAIQDIALDFKRYPRLFVAEYDFSNFFGNISHDYLLEQLKYNGFFVSERENKLIRAFITNSNNKGIPQGSSISLFLANLVCWQLDKQLEELGVRFARYADDTIIWTNDYTKICKAVEVMDLFSKEVGVPINLAKSEGVHQIVKAKMPSELYRNKLFIEFLGYKVTLDNISIKEEAVRKIKKNISYILYKNLIKPINTLPMRATKAALPDKDKDRMLLVAISEVRRYLYGNLNEHLIGNYLSGQYKWISFKGLMSFYPLITDVDQLKELDGWLVAALYRTIQKRKKILIKNGIHIEGSKPFNLSQEELIDYCKTAKINDKNNLLRIPSFITIYRVVQKGLKEQGIEGVMNHKTSMYNYHNI